MKEESLSVGVSEAATSSCEARSEEAPLPSIVETSSWSSRNVSIVSILSSFHSLPRHCRFIPLHCLRRFYQHRLRHEDQLRITFEEHLVRPPRQPASLSRSLHSRGNASAKVRAAPLRPIIAALCRLEPFCCVPPSHCVVACYDSFCCVATALTLVSLGMKSVSVSRHMPSSEFSSPHAQKSMFVSFCTAISRIPLSFRSFSF